MIPCRQLDLAEIRTWARFVSCRHGITLGTCPIDTDDLEQEAALRLLMGRQSVSGPMQDLLRGEPRPAEMKRERWRAAKPERATPSIPDLSVLRERTRMVLELRYWRGWRYKRIGAFMGFGESMAKQIETAGIERLRKAMR